VDVAINPVLGLQATARSLTYHLQLAADSTFTEPVYDQAGITNTSLMITGLSYSTRYYWRVNAENEFGTSPWSKVFQFTTKGTDPWAIKEPMPTPRSDLAAGVVNNKIYCIGGARWRLGTGESEYLTTVEEYDPITDLWVKKAGMRVKRAGLAAGVVNNKIYCIGGRNEQGELATVEEYDPVNDRWSPKKGMPTPRAYLAAGVVNSKIYCIGGGMVEEYDPVNDRWSTKASFPDPHRFHPVIGVVDNRIYCLWGEVWMYEVDADTWVRKYYFAPGPNNPAVGTVDNRIYVIGGWAGLAGGSIDIVYEYDPALDSTGSFRRKER